MLTHFTYNENVGRRGIADFYSKLTTFSEYLMVRCYAIWQQIQVLSI